MMMEDLAVPYLVPAEIGYVGNTHGTEVGEVLSDERDGVRTRPERGLNMDKLGMVVVAPFTLAEAIATVRRACF
jgi:hypothetical protein